MQNSIIQEMDKTFQGLEIFALSPVFIVHGRSDLSFNNLVSSLFLQGSLFHSPSQVSSPLKERCLLCWFFPKNNWRRVPCRGAAEKASSAKDSTPDNVSPALRTRIPTVSAS